MQPCIIAKHGVCSLHCPALSCHVSCSLVHQSRWCYGLTCLLAASSRRPSHYNSTEVTMTGPAKQLSCRSSIRRSACSANLHCQHRQYLWVFASALCALSRGRVAGSAERPRHTGSAKLPGCQPSPCEPTYSCFFVWFHLALSNTNRGVIFLQARWSTCRSWRAAG